MDRIMPSATVINRYDEALIAMQITEKEKEAIADKVKEPILVLCTKRYHNGTLGIFIKGNIYAIPKAMYEALAKRKKGRRTKQFPLVPIKKPEAEKHLARNAKKAKELARQRYKDITGDDLPEKEEIDVGPIGIDLDLKKDVTSPENEAAESPETK